MKNDKPVLPAQLYPAAFWASVILLLLGLVSPLALSVGVLVLMLAPVAAAVIVVVGHWRPDRSLAIAALLALLGLAAVFVLRTFLT